MDNQHKLISGYRDLTQEEIDKINEVKEKAEEIRKILYDLERMNDVDHRWLAIGTTDLQKGFMSVIRAIAKPNSF